MKEQTDINQWERKLNIEIYFATGTNKIHTKSGWLNKEVPSTWETPPQTWEFKEDLQRKKKNLLSDKDAGPPTHPEILEAAEELRNMKDIHILPADKGRNVVIWKTEDYDREANRQLGDTSTYEELDETKYRERLQQLATTSDLIAEDLKKQQNISPREERAIKASKPEGSSIYFLPKPHKGLNKTTGTFYGRPVVATHSAKIHLLDKYITALTTPLLDRIPGSLRDTNHLIEKLPKKVRDKHTQLATADVIGLYPNIPWEEGVIAAASVYHKNLEWLTNWAAERNLMTPIDTNMFIKILRLVLQNSYISFKNKRYFKQTQGTAMGMCISVYFANAYMYILTRKIINRPPRGITMFLRYIDDFFVIFEPNEGSEVEELFSLISNKNIRYTVEKPSKKQPFLDLMIEIDEETLQIETETYWKETASGSFLHPKSNHPQHTIRSIPKSQFLRLRRNASTNKRYYKGALRLKEELSRLTYPNEWIKEAMIQVDQTYKKTEEREFAHSTKLITKYNQAATKTIDKRKLDELHQEICTHYEEENEPISKKLRDKPSKLVTRVGRHLGTYFTKNIKNPDN